ncbi:hypothetical protein LYSHEL_06600 [Lysobacter helvus]|uniref:Prepilin-type N-terminal cleavage/methylation domain-containing protein n=2 Tax=Lysobacteraceae TaxID=32033 RepID=A0ABN6FQC3_9GAMM|nr:MULTISPECIES: prepilin-type N-terminal cleavage/methylation domain-containing protein [Lysobacter]BCT91636.1 hypothetical protein LYSCAS_06600 [Lysobacter caseinilyticus]BCT94789.1 hypothetical protein LYSHEL_06600 [Lysobacter helvus]
MKHRILRRHDSEGFSLLEVLIAIVVLSVGLLALAALQGSLSRASSEAKVRGRVAAMLAGRMDELRSGGYGGLTPEGAATPVTSTTGDCDPATPDATDWIDCTRAQAALGSLTTTQRVDTWYGASTFATPAPALGSQDPRVAQFKRITLTAAWTDATNGAHSMAITSDVSAMALTNNIIVPPDPIGVGGTGPIVRTRDPATAGVIPIALSTESTSATTNPVPELVGQTGNQIIGTRFTVLNYTPPFASSVVVQKRFENEVVKCKCKYGAGGNNLPEIFRTAQWPAIWTGDRYDVHVPDTAAAAPGQSLASGPKNGVDQSALCQECCRDHHDTTSTTDVKFDPERDDGSVAKYDLNNSNALVIVNNTNNGDYVDSCRLVRIDGFWRTASDLYARQFGLLETETVSGETAKTGVPTTAAVNLYTNFVKSFLAQYTGSSGLPPTDAQAAFTANTAFDVPTVVAIPTASNTDYRYMHGRALYVDHLEQKARDALTKALADTGTRGECPTGTAAEDCVMPHLPFVTANLTEIAKWTASNTAILTINSGNLLSTTPAQPSGGRTIGKANGAANNLASIRRSNSGAAVNSVQANIAGVDPNDDTQTYADQQPFTVGGGPSGATFDVRVTGGSGTPFVFFTLGTDTDRECLKPAGADHHCVTSSGTVLPQSGTVRVSNYWYENTTSQSVTATCGTRSATDTLAVPTFHNYVVSSASVNAVAGTIGLPLNDGKITESTTITFSAIPQGGLVLVGLTEQTGSPVYATISSCTTNGGGNKISNVVWNKPWTLP